MPPKSRMAARASVPARVRAASLPVALLAAELRCASGRANPIQGLPFAHLWRMKLGAVADESQLDRSSRVPNERAA
jgi:hypothetical protein